MKVLRYGPDSKAHKHHRVYVKEYVADEVRKVTFGNHFRVDVQYCSSVGGVASSIAAQCAAKRQLGSSSHGLVCHLTSTQQCCHLHIDPFILYCTRKCKQRDDQCHEKCTLGRYEHDEFEKYQINCAEY